MNQILIGFGVFLLGFVLCAVFGGSSDTGALVIAVLFLSSIISVCTYLIVNSIHKMKS